VVPLIAMAWPNALNAVPLLAVTFCSVQTSGLAGAAAVRTTPAGRKIGVRASACDAASAGSSIARDRRDSDARFGHFMMGFPPMADQVLAAGVPTVMDAYATAQHRPAFAEAKPVVLTVR